MLRFPSVTFLMSDNYQGYPVRIYVIAGTCKARVHQTVTNDTVFTGSFNMLMTRVVY